MGFVLKLIFMLSRIIFTMTDLTYLLVYFWLHENITYMKSSPPDSTNKVQSYINILKQLANKFSKFVNQYNS